MRRGIAVLLELLSVIVWLKLAEHLSADGPFGWAGPVCGLEFSGLGAVIALGVSAPALWRQPAGGRQFWVLFTAMMGGIVGMVLYVLYVDPVVLKD